MQSAALCLSQDSDGVTKTLASSSTYSRLTDFDVQVLLTNIQAVLLALRAKTCNGYSGSLGHLNPLLGDMLALQRDLSQISSYGAAYPVQQGPRVDVFNDGVTQLKKSTLPSVGARGTLPGETITKWAATTFSVPETTTFSEAHLLLPFCAICLNTDVGETALTVALSSLMAIVEARCSFLTVRGLSTIIHCALMTKSDVVTDLTAHELFLSRVAGAHVTCLSHPAAASLPEEVYVEVVRAVVMVSVHPHATPLLKRVTESSLKAVVSLLYQRISGAVSSPLSSGSAGLSSASSPPASDADGTYMMSFISSLICGQISGRQGQGDSDREPESKSARKKTRIDIFHTGTVEERNNNISAIQLEGLWLAQNAILTLTGRLREPHFRPLLHAIQNDLCRALLVAGVRCKQGVVLSLIMRTVHLVINAASEFLVPQIYSFLRVLHLNPLSAAREEAMGSPTAAGSPVSSSSLRSILDISERRDILIESLSFLCSQGSFCRFCYTNYDLSSRYAAVLPQLCDVLLYQAHGRLEPHKESGGSPSQNSPRIPISDSHLMAMQAAANLVLTLTEVYQVREPPHTLLGQEAPQRTPLSNGVSAAARIPLVSVYPVTCADVDAAIQHTIKQKNLLVQFSSLFAESPVKKGIPFLLESATRVERGHEKEYMTKKNCWLVLAQPAGGREVGECLFRLSSLLDKRVLGEYIGEQGDFSTVRPEEGVMVGLPDGTEVAATELWDQRRDEESLKMGTASFFEAQLRGFIHQFNFKGKSLLDAIREMVYCLCLPGESQKIDRIMEMFANFWYEMNPPTEDTRINPFSSNSTAFILSFAIIMLNTDLHSSRLNQSMTFEAFHRMSNQADEARDIPEQYLREVYDDVLEHEIIMAEMIDKGFTNHVTWALEMGSCGDSVHACTVDEEQGRARPQRTSRSPRMCFWDTLEHYVPLRDGPSEEGLPGRNVACLDPVSQQLLSRYVFASVWKRALLLFNGVIKQTLAPLSAIPAGGEDLLEGIAHVSSIAPVEFSALLTSIRGLTAIVMIAKRLNVPEVVDYSYSCLLQNAENKSPGALVPDLLTLSKDLPRLLFIREVFALLPIVSSHISQYWSPLARLTVDLFTAGAFAIPSCPPEDQEVVRQQLERVPEALHQHPLVVQNGELSSASLVAPTSASDSGGGGGGWLSIWWSSAMSSKKTREQQESHQAVLRVRDCVPSIIEFLETTSSVPLEVFSQYARALTQASTDKFRSPTEVRNFSYIFSLICAIVCDRCSRGLETSGAMEVLPLVCGNVLQDLYQMIDKKVPVDNVNLVTAIEMSVPGTKTPLDSPVLWLRVLRRIISGIVSVMMTGLLSSRHSELMEPMEHLFHLASNVPKRVYPYIVTESVLRMIQRFLHGQRHAVIHEPASHDEQQMAFYTEHRDKVNAALHLIFLSLQVCKEMSTDLLLQHTGLLHLIAEKELYDAETQLQELIECALSLGLRVQSREAGHGDSGKNGAPSPANVLSLCAQTILRRLADLSSTNSAGCNSDSRPGEGALPLCQLNYILCLKAMGALAMREKPQRNGEEVMCLERCVIQGCATEPSMPMLALVYDELLFPLAETFASSSVEQRDGPHRDKSTLSRSEIAIDRAFYNYWGEEITPATRLRCRLILLLFQPLLMRSEKRRLAGEEIEAFFGLWKKVLNVFLGLHQLYVPENKLIQCAPSDIREIQCAVEEAVEGMATLLVQVTRISADLPAAEDVYSSTAVEMLGMFTFRERVLQKLGMTK